MLLAHTERGVVVVLVMGIRYLRKAPMSKASFLRSM